MVPPDSSANDTAKKDGNAEGGKGMSREKKLLIGLAVVFAGLVGLLLFFIWRRQDAQAEHPRAAQLAAPAAELLAAPPDEPAVPVVQVLAVRPESFQKVVVVRGQVAPGPVVDITAPTAGKLTGFAVEGGDHVRPGYVVASMHANPLPARQPVLDSTRIDMAAYRTRPRQTALVVTTTIPRLADPATDLQLASPVTGTVLSLPTLGGNLLSIGQTLVQVRISSPLTMNGLLDTATARRLRVGQDVNVQLDSGINVSGTLVQLGPVSSTRDDFQMLVELAELTGPAAQDVQPGTSGRMVAPAEVITAFKVPSSLLVPAQGPRGPNTGVGLMVVAMVSGTGSDAATGAGTQIATVAVTPVQPLAVTAPDAANTPQQTWLTGLPPEGAYVISAWPSPLAVGQRISLTEPLPVTAPTALPPPRP